MSTPINEQQATEQILQQQKQKVEELITIRKITADNAVFSRTEGGFVSMQFGDKTYPRVVIHRCFPFSASERYLSVREPGESGKEIGLIETLSDLHPDTQQMLLEQMQLRYFTPIIQKIHNITEEYGYSYWDVTTDRGRCRFTVRMGSGNVYAVGENRYLVNDLDGNRFEIPNMYALTPSEIKKLDLYI